MTSYPELSYVCPIRWEDMAGDDQERYCAKCARHVINLSRLAPTERDALLANPPPGGLCVAYRQYLTPNSGNLPALPVASRLAPWSVIAATAATLAAGVQFAPEVATGIPRAKDAVALAVYEMEEQGWQILYKLGLCEEPVMVLGMLACPPPSALAAGTGSAGPTSAP